MESASKEMNKCNFPNCQFTGCSSTCGLKPCKSPYCECEKGKCEHPGSYDARSTPTAYPELDRLVTVLKEQLKKQTEYCQDQINKSLAKGFPYGIVYTTAGFPEQFIVALGSKLQIPGKLEVRVAKPNNALEGQILL